MSEITTPLSKFTNNDVFTLFSFLTTLKGLKGVTLNYAVARNIAKLKTEVDSMKISLEVSDEFKKYDEARVELAKKYAKKNEKGEPEVATKIGQDGKPTQEYIIEDMEAFKKDFETLKEESRQVIEDREHQLKDFEKLLKEDSTIELFKVKIEDIPQDITTEQMAGLFPIVE